MSRRLRKGIVPAFLLLCLLLGGSVRGLWGNLALQLVAVGIIAWAAIAPAPERPTRPARQLIGLAVLGLLLILVQLIPLPPSLWTALPGREPVVAGYRLLGQPLPWLPVSMTPYDTLAMVVGLLPPLAILLCILRLKAIRESWAAAAVLTGALAGILLGAAQAATGSPRVSSWYLYDITNSGAVGFFANSNHMATLLLVSIPFAVALFASRGSRSGGRRRSAALAAIGAIMFFLLLLGLVLNGSLAGLALAIPVIALSAMLLPAGWRYRRIAVPAVALAFAAALAVLAINPIRSEIAGVSGSQLSRPAIWATAVDAAEDGFPAGTGLGSFEEIYRLYEDPAAVTATYVNHAHNDYLELVLETGILGAVLVLLFLLWWARQFWTVWRSPLSGSVARAASIASAAMLAHSLVDYPLRTTALAAVFAMALALMAQPVRRTRDADDRSGAARHLTIG